MAPWVSHTALTPGPGTEGFCGTAHRKPHTQNYGITGCFGWEGILKLIDPWQFRTAWICHAFSRRWGQGDVQLLGTGEGEQEGEA